MWYLSDFFSPLLEITASFMPQRGVAEPLEPSPGYATVTANFVRLVFKNSVRYIYCDNCLSLIGLFLFSEGD